jgi:hypothetical protein
MTLIEQALELLHESFKNVSEFLKDVAYGKSFEISYSNTIEGVII